MEDAKKHVKFCIELYMEQVRGGRYFLHEHPENATSWQMPEVIELAAQAGVGMTVCDMCAYGMEITDKDGEALVRKSTKVLTNADEVAKRISRRCSNRKEFGESLIPPLTRLQPKLRARHRHADILGGHARQCQVYPREFCKEVCAGVAAQKRLHEMGMCAKDLMNLDEISAVDPNGELHEETPTRMSSQNLTDPPWIMDPSEWFATDDLTGANLDPKLVAEARREEIRYFKSRGVYEKVPIEESWHQTGKAPIAVRWVDINKGDEVYKNYRSRLVAKEFRTDLRPDLYAATPPSECLKFLISMMASNRGFKIMYADVSRAYFYAKAVRPVYVQLPDEDKEEGDEARCGKLLMSMYGTRDAALNWSQEYTRTLMKSGYVQGSANPCLFHHPVIKVAGMVHGDDFVAVGREEDLKETRKS